MRWINSVQKLEDRNFYFWSQTIKFSREPVIIWEDYLKNPLFYLRTIKKISTNKMSWFFNKKSYQNVAVDEPPPYEDQAQESTTALELNVRAVELLAWSTKSLKIFLDNHEERMKAPLCCLHDYLECELDYGDVLETAFERLKNAMPQDVKVQNYMTEFYLSFILEDPRLHELWTERGLLTKERIEKGLARLERTKQALGK